MPTKTAETFTKPEAVVMTRRIQRPGIEASRVEKLRAVVDEASEAGEFAIVVAQIDPDALGSAFGMEEILTKLLGQKVSIYYSGKVAHPQNEALCNKYNLIGRMKPIRDLYEVKGDEELVCKTPNVVLVDSCLSRDGRLPAPVHPVIVVDHHRNSDVEEHVNTFVWLDEDGCGSASTMVAELLSEMAPDDHEIRGDLAVMLALGIYSDTKARNRAGTRDEAAYMWCKRYADNTDLIRLILYKRPFSFLKNLAKGVGYIEAHDTYRQGRILAGLGRLPEKQGDDLAMVADELLRTIGAPLAGTWAVIEVKDPQTNEITLKLRFCARSEEIGINLASTLQARFGKNSGAKILPDGTGEGGALFEFPTVQWIEDYEMEEIAHKRIMAWFFEMDESSENKTE